MKKGRMATMLVVIEECAAVFPPVQLRLLRAASLSFTPFQSIAFEDKMKL